MTVNIFIGAVIAILFTLLCREIVCWYFKINQRLDALEEISEKLTVIINQNNLP